jgi:hypothetical protein
LPDLQRPVQHICEETSLPVSPSTSPWAACTDCARKCGRVVCNSCSPHRITIPYQYIVQPPGTPRVLAQRYPSVTSMDSGFSDFSTLGGGERVRLCNPCVPDPNTTPPRTQDSHAGRTHLRTQSSTSNAFSGDAPRRYGTYFPPMPAGEALIRSRSVTLVSTQQRCLSFLFAVCLTSLSTATRRLLSLGLGTPTSRVSWLGRLQLTTPAHLRPRTPARLRWEPTA